MPAATRQTLILICLLALFALPARAATHEELQEKIDAFCRETGTVGMAAAYVRGGRVEETFAFGYATRGKDPMTADTSVRIASISKVMVGIAAHMSAYQGLVDLDAPLDIPLGFTLARHSAADSVSLRSILTHTSSIYPLPAASGVYDRLKELLQDPENFYSSTSGDLRNWDYNNFAFYALGVAIERANGLTMDQILDAALCDALEIDASFWAGDLEDQSHIATLYDEKHNAVLTVEAQTAVHSAGVGANGAVFAGNYHISARDLGKIVATLAADGCYEGVRVLPYAVVEGLESYINAKVPDHNFYQAQPLCFRKNIYGRKGLYYHTGSAYGAQCLICYDPWLGDGVVVLSSGGSGYDRSRIYKVCGQTAELLLNEYK